MKINFGEIREYQTINYGDVVITEEGNKYLIIKDDDGGDYRALNLETFVPTGVRCLLTDLLDTEVREVIRDVIKSDNLELRKC